MFSESVSMTYSDGTELKKLTYEDRENPDIERFVLEDGQTFTFEFQILDWNAPKGELVKDGFELATPKMMEKIDYNRLKLDEREPDMSFENLRVRDFNLDEDQIEDGVAADGEGIYD